jgi:hypothetical protein
MTSSRHALIGSAGERQALYKRPAVTNNAELVKRCEAILADVRKNGTCAD